ncbi:MAG TPA: hypothetical protein VKG78_00720 [Opitutaceae bacterium]|nr:hypothetical protein [Opitutaceae bacterium]
MCRIRIFLLVSLVASGQSPAFGAAPPIRIDAKDVLLVVDPAGCRWSAQVKGTPMQLNEVNFPPGDDPSGWTVNSWVDNDDLKALGSFATVDLRGTRAGQLGAWSVLAVFNFTGKPYQTFTAPTGSDVPWKVSL